MLLHDYLRKKSAIISKAQAEVKTLLTEITDPKTKELVDDWEPGDPITDLYPQFDQKTDEPAKEEVPVKTEGTMPPPHVIPEGVIGSLAPIESVVESPDATAEVAQATGEEKLNDTNHTV